MKVSVRISLQIDGAEEPFTAATHLAIRGETVLQPRELAKHLREAFSKGVAELIAVQEVK